MLQQQANPSYGSCPLLQRLLSHTALTGTPLASGICIVAVAAVTYMDSTRKPLIGLMLAIAVNVVTDTDNR